MTSNIVEGKAAFVDRLRRWRDETDLSTLRDRGLRQGIGRLTVVVGEVEVDLVGDTKRARIEEFLAWVDANGVDAPWDVLPNTSGVIKNVGFGGACPSGWYFYLREPWHQGGTL